MSSHRRSRHHAPAVENQDSNSSNSGIINIITSTKTGINTFANDGSFLETFMKKMEEEKKASDGTSDGENTKTAENQKKSNVCLVKRRGGKVLKTGVVKKPKIEDYDKEAESNGPWAKYLAEVRKYKRQACDEDGKTRPLVK